MKLNTASSAISFSRRLEDDSAKVYENLMRKYPKGKETFLSFVRENEQNKKLVERTYYEVITDALEACFSFEGIETDDFLIETGLAKDASYPDALNKVIAIEEGIIKFYSVASEASRALMADVPRAFEKIAERRSRRIHKLRALLTGD